MNNQSISTARSSHKHPTLPSKTNYAYPFSKTKRFPDPAPPYPSSKAAALKPSIPTIRSSPPAKPAWASAKKLTWLPSYLLTRPLPPATVSHPSSTRTRKAPPLAPPAKSHQTAPTSSPKSTNTQAQPAYPCPHAV